MNRRGFLGSLIGLASGFMCIDVIEQLEPRKRELMQRALNGDPIARLAFCPWKVMDTPDPWQRDALVQLISNSDDVIMLCSRGAGKTEVFASASYLEACLGGFALILSRSERQAFRVMSYVERYARTKKLVPIARKNMSDMVLENGGRVTALPCSGDTIVGEHGVTLLGLDEAARISDSFYAVVTPMMGTSEAVTGIKPRLALLSTPFGKRGFFYREWIGEGSESWKRHRYDWKQCPRITQAYIDKEKRRHGETWVKQEYMDCKPGQEFLDTENAFFNVEAFKDLIDNDLIVDY